MSTAIASRQTKSWLCALAVLALGASAMTHGVVLGRGSSMGVWSAVLWLAPFPLGYALGRVSAGWRSQSALAALGVCIAAIGTFGDLPSAVSAGVAFSVTVAFPWWLGAQHRHRLRRHRQHIEAARRTERETLLRDMHDALGSDLAVIALQAGSMEIDDRLPSVVRERGALIRSYATGATDRMRSTLRAGASSHEGWETPSLADVVERARLTGTDVSMSARTGEPSVLIRNIVRECLTNSLKHAPGDPIDVCIDDTRVRVITRSPAPSGSSSGLAALTRHVVAEGGSIGYGRDRESGYFTVDAVVPVDSRTVTA